MKIKCTHCGSNDVTGSRRRGIERFVCDLTPLAPYRCRECWKRFWALHNPLENLSARIFWGVVLLLAVAFFALPSLREGPPAGPEKDLKPSVRRPVVGVKREPPPEGPKAREAAKGPEGEGTQGRALPPAGGAATGDRERDSLPAGAPGTGPKDEAPGSLQSVPAPGPVPGPQEALSPEAVPRRGALIKDEPSARQAGGDLPRSVTLIPGTSKGESELLISTEGPVPKYDSFFVGTPPRFVIDLAGRWKNSGPSEISLRGGKARAVRVGEHEDKLRIVLDLEGERPISPVIRAVPRGLIVSIR